MFILCVCVHVLDDFGVVVEEETMIVSSKPRPDQRPLDKIDMLSDWTAVSTTDRDADRSSIDEMDVPTADVNAIDSKPNTGVREEPDVEPITEDTIAGAKVTPRTNLGDDLYGKLLVTGTAAEEEVIAPGGSSVLMCSAPSSSPATGPDEVDRALVAPTRKKRMEGWIGQAARSDEFSWLAAESTQERRDSVDSLVVPDEVITAETSTRLESAPPLPAVDEDALAADTKPSAKFDVDFDACLLAEPRPAKIVRVASKPPVLELQPATEVSEEQIQTSKVSARKLNDCLAQSKIEFTDKTAPDNDERISLDEVEIVPEESQITRAAPIKATFEEPHVEEESIVRQSKQSTIIIPEFPASPSVSAKIEASPPKTKKSGGGGVFGFLKRKTPKNVHQNSSADSAKDKSNSLDKRTDKKRHEATEKSGSTLPADVKKDKGGLFHVNFGFGGKHARSSPPADDEKGSSARGQSPRTNSTGDNAKSPSKTNIRVFEIMAGQQNGADAAANGGGLKEQPVTATPPSSPEDPQVTSHVPPPVSVESPKQSPASSPSFVSPTVSPPVRGPPVDVHVSAAPVPPTVPAFSSQYMVAVAIDFGLFCSRVILSSTCQ